MSSFPLFLATTHGKKVLLLTHKAADVDAIASAAVLQNVFKKTDFTIGIPSYLNQQALKLSENHKIKHVINPVLSQFESIIVLDFNSLEMLGMQASEFEKFKKPVFLIDHHEDSGEELAEQKNSIIEPDAVSTTQIIYSILQETIAKISPKDAELLSAGIIADSNNLSAANSNSLKVLSQLLEKCNKTVSEVKQGFEIAKDVSERIASLKSAKRLRLFKAKDFLIALSTVSHFASSSADNLVSLGADLAFVAYSDKDHNVRLNSRASDSFLKKTGLSVAGILLELEEKFQGSAGGHEGAAGFNGIAKDSDELLQECLSLTTKFLKSKGFKESIKELKD